MYGRYQAGRGNGPRRGRAVNQYGEIERRITSMEREMYKLSFGIQTLMVSEKCACKERQSGYIQVLPNPPQPQGRSKPRHRFKTQSKREQQTEVEMEEGHAKNNDGGDNQQQESEANSQNQGSQEMAMTKLIEDCIKETIQNK